MIINQNRNVAFIIFHKSHHTARISVKIFMTKTNLGKTVHRNRNFESRESKQEHILERMKFTRFFNRMIDYNLITY